MDRDKRGGRSRGDSPDRLNVARHSGAGVEFIATIGAFLLLGWWLDRRWGTEPWLMIGGLAVGFAAAMYRLIRLLHDSPPKR